MLSLINLFIKSNSCFDRYKLAQKGAGSIPMEMRMVCNTVRFPTQKRQHLISCYTALSKEFFLKKCMFKFMTPKSSISREMNVSPP